LGFVRVGDGVGVRLAVGAALVRGGADEVGEGEGGVEVGAAVGDSADTNRGSTMIWSGSGCAVLSARYRSMNARQVLPGRPAP